MSLPQWAEWNPRAAASPWTVGIEEEVMLLDPVTWMPASRSAEALAALNPRVADHTAAETHGSAVELATDPQATVADAVAQLARLRDGLAAGLRELGLAAAVSGTHPLATWIALSGSSIPMCTCMPKMSSWRATKRSASMRSRYRGRWEIRWSSHFENGWVPADPIPRPFSSARWQT